MIKLALEWKHRWLKDKGIFSGSLRMRGLDSFLATLSGSGGAFVPETDILSAGGKPVALTLNLTGNGCRQVWLSAYDDTFTGMSHGMILHHMAVAGAIDAGLSSHSFLGHPAPFKESLCNETVPLPSFEKPLTPKGRLWLAVWSNGARPVAAVVVKQLWKFTR